MRCVLKVESHCLHWEVKCSELVLYIDYDLQQNILSAKIHSDDGENNLNVLEVLLHSVRCATKDIFLRNSLSLDMSRVFHCTK
jgi:hypothetical protein